MPEKEKPRTREEIIAAIQAQAEDMRKANEKTQKRLKDAEARKEENQGQRSP